ncbi:MAG TPA: hypothetical protein VLR88_03215 [Propionibacteriaceae bacterium]|nr:hypothetical protein [Propionibacteriaceae bacterium]
MSTRTRERALAAFVDHHLVGLRRSAYLLVGEWTRADQVVEAALSDLYRDHTELADESASLTRARRLLVHEIDRAHRLATGGSDLIDFRPRAVSAEEKLMAALDQLGLHDRAAVVLSRFDHLPDAEIGAILDTDGAEAVARGLSHLRDALARSGDSLILEEDEVHGDDVFRRPDHP